MDIFVKRAVLQDSHNIAALFDDYRVFYGQPSDKSVALEFITQRLENNESVIFFACDAKGVFLGFTQLYPSFSSVSAKRSWILNDLYVAAGARRSGVARTLMNAAKDFAIGTGAKGLSLSTARSNVIAQALYESLGYEKDSDFYSYYLRV